MNNSRRVVLWGIGLLLTLYGADAVFPTWDYSCSGHQTAAGWYIGPNRIKELEADPTARFVRPTVPTGCSVHAHNSARNVFDWLTGR